MENKNIILSPIISAKGYSDFTIHKVPKRKQRYKDRHEETENWTKSGLNTAGF